jgi:hypothetical protein
VKLNPLPLHVFVSLVRKPAKILGVDRVLNDTSHDLHRIVTHTVADQRHNLTHACGYENQQIHLQAQTAVEVRLGGVNDVPHGLLQSPDSMKELRMLCCNFG